MGRIIMKCSNCGGDFEENEEKCPYCGELNYKGAKQKHIRKLQNTKSDLGKLKEIPGSVCRKQTIIWLLLSCFIVSISFFSFFVPYKLVEKAESKKVQQLEEENYERILWQDEHFPKFDTWYQKKEYDKILQAYESANESAIYYDISHWGHVSFLECYGWYHEIEKGQMMISDQTTVKGSDLAFSIEAGLCLIFKMDNTYLEKLENDTNWKYRVTADEKKEIQKYRQVAKEYLYKKLQVSEEESRELYEASMREGYFSSYTLSNMISEWKWEQGRFLK